MLRYHPRAMTSFRIITPAYETARWIGPCVRSVRDQSGVDFRAVVLDDCSTDATFEKAEAAMGGDARFTLVRGDTRVFQLARRIEGIRKIAESPDDVIVLVDGDDWLAHDRVLERLAREYEDPDTWLTYGSYRSRKPKLTSRLRFWRRRLSTKAFPREVLEQRLVRYHWWIGGHLMTFKRFLFDGIKDEDLRDEEGRYFGAGTDLALMFPMMEMAGPDHVRHIPEPLYIWNKHNPQSRMAAYKRMQDLSGLQVRAKPRYEQLER